jgi:hypothetical protein
VISGHGFEVLGISNIGEQDFFAWVLAPEVKALTLDVFRHLATSLIVYDLKRIDEDLLNAPSVDAAIKSHQTRGLYGPRHIHRRPFEVCTIPEFDPGDANHLRLAELSAAAQAAVARLDLCAGGVVGARKQARAAAVAQIAEIDHIARRILGLAETPVTVPADDADNAEGEEEGDLDG